MGGEGAGSARIWAGGPCTPVWQGLPAGGAWGSKMGGSRGGKSQVRRERAKAGGVVDEAGPLESPPGKHNPE